MTKKVMLIHKYIIVASILLFATSCSNTGDDIGVQEKMNYFGSRQMFQDADTARKAGKGNTKSDPFTIISVERAGDILKVKVSYSGGCIEHTFDIIWGGEILLSYPCQIGLILTHDANGDQCEANITETLEIDLNKLVGDNEYKDACTYNVFSILNESDDPDGTVNSLDN